jgi:zinc-ribbon domain
VICPRCGSENQEGARFCNSCGASLSPDEQSTEPMRPPQGSPEEPVTPSAGERPPEAGEQTAPLAPPPGPPGAVATMTSSGPPPRPPRPGPGEILGAGWGRAVVRAVIAFAVLALIGQGLSLLQSGSNPEEVVGTIAGIPSVPGQPAPQLRGFEIVQGGALTFFQFHNVTIELQFPQIPFPGGETPFLPTDISVRFAATLMFGALLGLWLLFLGGRAVAREAGGPGWARPLHGAKVALPYAVLALAYSFLAQVSVDESVPGLPAGSGPPTIGVAILSAVWWPLLFGLVAGPAGGITTGPLLAGRGSTWERRSRAAISGGWVMAALAVALSFVGFLVLAAVNPEVTGAYFRLVAAGDLATGASIIIGTVLFLPNASTGIAAAAMGGSMGLDLFGSSCALISYAKFPLRATDAPSGEPSPFAFCDAIPVDFGIAPIGYFLFLLVPIAATVLGGIRAARRADAVTTGEATSVGAAAGVVFAVVLLGFMILARITAVVDVPFFSGFLGGGGLAAGPDLLSGTLLALVWGAAGGALGGLVAGRRIEKVQAGDPGFSGESP